MMGRRRVRRECRSEHGAAAVEFAIIVPFLVLILLGIISYGFMLSFRQALSQAAAESARAAAVTVVDAERTDAARRAVGDALTASGVTCEGAVLRRSGATVGACEVSAPADCAGAPTVGGETPQCVTVRLAYDYDSAPLAPAFPGTGLILPDTLVYSSTARVS